MSHSLGRGSPDHSLAGDCGRNAPCCRCRLEPTCLAVARREGGQTRGRGPHSRATIMWTRDNVTDQPKAAPAPAPTPTHSMPTVTPPVPAEERRVVAWVGKSVKFQ